VVDLVNLIPPGRRHSNRLQNKPRQRARKATAG
jgi:hypothetical protein